MSDNYLERTVSSSNTRLTALDKNRHRNFSVRQNSLAHTANLHTCAALLGEYSDLASEYPIVFVRTENGDGLRSVALLGVKPGQNLFWQKSQWQGRYLPLAVRAQPFAAVGVPGSDDRIAICIDESSPLSIADGRRGEPLFDRGGAQTEYLGNVSRFLAQIYRQEALSRIFVGHLEEKDLLEEQVMLVNLPGGVDHRLTGVFRINESALNKLPDRDFVDLRKKGYLPAIYAQIQSLRQVHNLSRLHAQMHRENVH